MNMFFGIMKRDLKIAYRRRSEYIISLLFLTIIVTIFSLATGQEKDVLKKIGPGILWASALLATLLSLEQLFRQDYEDGTLEQLIVSEHSTSLMVLAKLIIHWFVTSLPLILLYPLLALMVSVPEKVYWVLFFTLLLGTPILSFVGAIGLALTVGLARGGLLLAIFIIPLYIPTFLFGLGAVAKAADGLDYMPNIMMLLGIFVLWLTLSPLLTASALKVSLR